MKSLGMAKIVDLLVYITILDKMGTVVDHKKKIVVVCSAVCVSNKVYTHDWSLTIALNDTANGIV